MSVQPKAILLICIVILISATSCLLVFSSQKNAEQMQAERRGQRLDKRYGRHMARMQMMNEDDGIRFSKITRSVVQTHTISDGDLDWMLMLLKKPASSTSNNSMDQLRSSELKMIDLGTLRLMKQTSPQQQAKVFVALVPFLYGNDPISKGEADMTLAAFKVTQAIPYIRPQLKDSNSGVRRDAKAALAAFAS